MLETELCLAKIIIYFIAYSYLIIILVELTNFFIYIVYEADFLLRNHQEISISFFFLDDQKLTICGLSKVCRVQNIFIFNLTININHQ